MGMHRFFTDPSNITGEKITLSGDDARHIGVLRLSMEENIVICDGQGMDYICRLCIFERDMAVCEIIRREANLSEPDIKTVLFQGLPKADKMELIIQKCVELGICEIVPVITANTVVKANEKTIKKTERYNKISEAAAKQSGRGIIPRVWEPVSFNEAVIMLSHMEEAYMAYERETARSLRVAFGKPTAGKNCGFLIGSEGGFTDDEACVCERAGIIPVSLGKRILRTETAGFVILTVYNYAREGL